MLARIKVPVKGQSIVELATGLVVLIPVVMALVDMAFLLAATQVNDSACRDAARAAAAGPPAEAFQRVSQVIHQVYQEKGIIQGPFVKKGDVTTVPDPIPDPGPSGGLYQGTLKVKTSVKLTMPVQVPFIPQTTKPMDLYAQQEFPITCVKPASNP